MGLEQTPYFFSIVIPTYNRAILLSRTISSILKQTYPDFEIIIVDDGSTDDTIKVIYEFKNPNIKYFKTENSGVAHARNYGIKKASGKYIGFLDSDDLMESYHLKTAYDFLKKENEPEVIHLNFLWGDESKLKTQKNKLPSILPDDIFKSCSLHVNCIFIRNDIAKFHLFNESRDLMFVEDWDFFIKLNVRFNIRLLDKTTTYLIDHEDRSMRNFDEEKWVLKRDAIVLSLLNDEFIKKKYTSKIKLISAHMNSLIAVNYAVRKNKIKCIHFWVLALKQNYFELFTRRSLAIAKHLILNW